MPDPAGMPHSGHQPNGGYVLLASERELDCKHLNDEIDLGLKDMGRAKSAIERERDKLPSTMVSLYGRMFGGPDGGLKAAETYHKTEARVRALNQQLGAKGCHSSDIDGRILALNLAPMSGADPGTGTAASAAATPAGAPPASNSLQSEIEAMTSVWPTALKW